MWSCAKDATAFNKALVPSVLATTWRRRQSVSANAKQRVGKLGETFLGSKSIPIPKPTEEESEISGSDVLWALQRAGGRKKEHRRESSSGVDYTNLRPLRINPNWVPKLDYLDKRLRELSDTI